MQARSKSQNFKKWINKQSKIKWMILLSKWKISLKNIREIEEIRNLSPRKDHLLNRDRIIQRIIRIRVVLMKKSVKIFLFKISIYDF